MITRIPVKLTPKSSKDAVEGWSVDPEGRPVLKVRVRAQPVEGAANTALIALVAKVLKVPRRDVNLARGSQSRLKMLEVSGLSDAEVRERLSAG